MCAVSSAWNLKPMDFPGCSYPLSICQHSGEVGCLRRNFAEYGSFSQVDCYSQKDGSSIEMKCQPQKGMGIFNGLDCNLPPLPLYNYSLSDHPLIQDRILDLTHYEDAIKSAMYVQRKLPYAIKGGYQKKISENKALIDKCVSKPAKVRHWKDLNKEVPDDIKTLLREYSAFADVSNENCMMGFNRDFYQGLLCHKQTSNSTVLFHAAGKKFTDIYVTDVSQKEERLPVGSPLTKVALDESIFQLTCSEHGVLCARQANQSIVLTYDDSRGSINEYTQTGSFGKRLSDVTFSPYNKDELLVSATTGHVCLWNFNSGSHKKFRKVSKSQCPVPWSCSHFSGHPRQIVVSDCFSMGLFDHRDNFSKGIELFQLSDRWVKSHERVMAATSLGFPYHLAATDFTLFLIDQRFPGFPVLQWSTPNVNNAQYLKSLKLSEVGSDGGNGGNDHFIFLGSQQPAEVVCYPVHLSKTCAPVTKTIPWGVGKIEDFTNREKTTYQMHLYEAERRFQSSLAGMTVINQCSERTPHISVYQMDAYGDIFFQNFEMNQMLGNPGCYKLVGPSANEKKAADRRATEFLKSIDQTHVLDKGFHASWLESNPNSAFSFSAAKGLFTDGNRVDPQATIEDAGKKYGAFARTLSKDSYTESDLIRMKNLCRAGPNTRLLLALKEKEDIQDALVEREESYERQKKRLRVQYLEEKEQMKHTKIVKKKIAEKAEKHCKKKVKVAIKLESSDDSDSSTSSDSDNE